VLSKFGRGSVCAVLASNAGVCCSDSSARTTHQEIGHPVAVQKRRKPGTPVGSPKMIITAIPVHNEVRYI
jgi:hypothetical protein